MRFISLMHVVHASIASNCVAVLFFLALFICLVLFFFVFIAHSAHNFEQSGFFWDKCSKKKRRRRRRAKKRKNSSTRCTIKLNRSVGCAFSILHSCAQHAIPTYEIIWSEREKQKQNHLSMCINWSMKIQRFSQSKSSKYVYHHHINQNININEIKMIDHIQSNRRYNERERKKTETTAWATRSESDWISASWNFVVNEKSYDPYLSHSLMKFGDFCVCVFFLLLTLCQGVYLHTTTQDVQKYLKIIILFMWTRILFNFCFAVFFSESFPVCYSAIFAGIDEISKTNCIIQLIHVNAQLAFRFSISFCCLDLRSKLKWDWSHHIAKYMRMSVVRLMYCVRYKRKQLLF